MVVAPTQQRPNATNLPPICHQSGVKTAVLFAGRLTVYYTGTMLKTVLTRIYQEDRKDVLGIYHVTM